MKSQGTAENQGPTTSEQTRGPTSDEETRGKLPKGLCRHWKPAWRDNPD